MKQLEKRSVGLTNWRTMFGLREKLSLCFAGLLIIVMALGVQSIIQLNSLKASVDAIVQENFATVVATSDMKEGLQNMDSGILSWLLGYKDDGLELLNRGRSKFHAGLESAKTENPVAEADRYLANLEGTFSRYESMISSSLLTPPVPGKEDELYLQGLRPLFAEMDGYADKIQQFNRNSIVAQETYTRGQVNAAEWQTIGVLGIALVLAFAAIYFSGRWLLLPIIYLTQAAEEIRTGNLDVEVPVTSEDELGILVRTFNDMVERVRKFQKTQKARLLRSSTANLMIMDNLPDAIALISAENEVEMASRVAADAFGLVPLKLLDDNGRPWILDLVERAEQDEETVTGANGNEVIQAFLEGEERFYYPSAVAIRDDDENVTGTLLIFRDITDFQQQQELKQDAIATVSHQLKTPLTSIQMALHMLRGGKFGELNEKQSNLLETASEESDRLLRMVLSLLDTSRIKSGRVMLECASTPLSSLIGSIVEDVNNEAAPRELHLLNEITEEVPEVWVDPGRIEHVFNNLLRNAVCYTPEGSEVRVRAGIESEWIRVDVRDNGPGISEDDCQHLFEQFYRGAGSDMSSGAGLGLYIAKQIVEAHSGKIEVEGGLGVGACFSVWLPRADAVESLGLQESN